MAAMATALSAKWLADRYIRQLAYFDTLTGLPNRQLFRERCSDIVAQAGPNQIGVVLLDLDRFKNINDSLGHIVGDTLIKQASRRLIGLLRDNDTPARLERSVLDAAGLTMDRRKTRDGIFLDGARRLVAPSRLFLAAGELVRLPGLAQAPQDALDLGRSEAVLLERVARLLDGASLPEALLLGLLELAELSGRLSDAEDWLVTLKNTSRKRKRLQVFAAVEPQLGDPRVDLVTTRFMDLFLRMREADPDEYIGLTLDVRYDDGFVAYLNGTKIAERNAPASPAFDSTATAGVASLDACPWSLDDGLGLLFGPAGGGRHAVVVRFHVHRAPPAA
mgnify:CR=1 FL=1